MEVWINAAFHLPATILQGVSGVRASSPRVRPRISRVIMSDPAETPLRVTTASWRAKKEKKRFRPSWAYTEGDIQLLYRVRFHQKSQRMNPISRI